MGRRRRRARRPRASWPRVGTVYADDDVSSSRRSTPRRRPPSGASAESTSWSPTPASRDQTTRPGSTRWTSGDTGHRDRSVRRLLLLPRGRPAHADSRSTAASSTSRRSPARKATRTPRRTAPRRPGVIALTEVARQGTGRREHRRQRRHASRREDAHLRPDDAGVPQVHAVEDSTRPLPGDRRAGVARRPGSRRKRTRSRPARSSTSAASTYLT